MVIFNLQLKGSLDAWRWQGEQERTSERDEGGRGGRLALRAPGTTEGEKSATLTILSEQGWMRLLVRAFCALRAVDGDHEREHLWWD